MNRRVYETGTAAAVRAWHVMAGQPGPEGARHSHDYRLDVVVGREELDGRGMVVDLDRLTGALHALTERLHDADLDTLCPEHAGAVTVERFAEWLHRELAAALAADHPAVRLRVRVWESADAFGGYAAELSGSW
jgi:6-pyruvoyl-tetrahydropterin synthase